MDQEKLPRDFVRATWRGTLTPRPNGDVGVSFNVEGGSVVRLVLDAESVRNLRDTLRASWPYVLSVGMAIDGSASISVDGGGELELSPLQLKLLRETLGHPEIHPTAESIRSAVTLDPDEASGHSSGSTESESAPEPR